jgi:EpsI family protein
MKSLATGGGLPRLSLHVLAALGLYGLLMALLYTPSLKIMVAGWGREDYNYCYLVPFVVLYLIWEKRRELRAVPSRASWWGLPVVGLGLLFYWVGELGGEYLTLYLSCWLVLAGLCWMHLGWRKLKLLGFPLALLLTLFPLPSFLYNQVSLKLQLLSSQLGVTWIRLIGMTAYREGNVIDLGFTRLQVVEACSGLRYIFSLLVLGLILAYFFRTALWKRVALVAAVIPLSIVVNSARIAFAALSHQWWGPAVAEGFLHDFSGWAIFMVSLAVLLAFQWVLSLLPGGAGNRSLPDSQGASPQADAGESPGGPVLSDKAVASETGTPAPIVTPAVAGVQGSLEKLDSGFRRNDGQRLQTEALKHESTACSPLAGDADAEEPRRVGAAGWLRPAAAVALMGATLVLTSQVEFRERIPIRESLDRFPLQVAQWTGVRRQLEEKFIQALDFSDYTLVDYRNPAGKTVNFYVAYYETQRKGESIHSPETCLIGGGWVFTQKGRKTFDLGGNPHSSITVNRVVMEQPGARMLSYFWFPQRGRVLTNAVELKIYNFWDALTRQRTDGSLVRIITPLLPHESPEQADERLEGFARDAVPLLSRFLPGF